MLTPFSKTHRVYFRKETFMEVLMRLPKEESDKLSYFEILDMRDTVVDKGRTNRNKRKEFRDWAREHGVEL